MMLNLRKNRLRAQYCQEYTLCFSYKLSQSAASPRTVSRPSTATRGSIYRGRRRVMPDGIGNRLAFPRESGAAGGGSHTCPPPLWWRRGVGARVFCTPSPDPSHEGRGNERVGEDYSMPGAFAPLRAPVAALQAPRSAGGGRSRCPGRRALFRSAGE